MLLCLQAEDLHVYPDKDPTETKWTLKEEDQVQRIPVVIIFWALSWLCSVLR